MRLLSYLAFIAKAKIDQWSSLALAMNAICNKEREEGRKGRRKEGRKEGRKGIRFSLHRDARAAARGLYLHKDLRAAEIRFYLHKEFLKKNVEKSGKINDIFEKSC